MWAGLLNVTVGVGVGLDGGDRIHLQTVAMFHTLLYMKGDPHSTLMHILGIRVAELEVNSSQNNPNNEIVVLRPNLQGEYTVQLYSTALSGSRTSLDGNGATTRCITTIPLTVPYGAIQYTAGCHVEVPSITYGPQDNHSLHAVDVSLRYMDGTPIDLQGTKLFVTIRIWTPNR
jgi:hypothetical protein